MAGGAATGMTAPALALRIAAVGHGGRSKQRQRRGAQELSERDAFERIVDLLSEAMLEDARWPETSALIDEACGTQGSLLSFGGGSSVETAEVYFARYYHRGEDRSAWQREYFRHYFPTDESIPRMVRLPDGRTVRTADLYSEDERKTSPTYNEALRRYGAQNGLTVRLDGPSGSHIVWSTADPAGADGWSSSRVDMVARLLPELRRYVRVRSAIAEAGALGATVAGLLDNTRAGIIHLDRRGRIVEANDSARALLREDDGLSDKRGALQAAWPEDDARLQNLLARALPGLVRRGASGSILIRRRLPLPRFALHVKPVTDREVDYRARDVAALVLIVDPVSRVRVAPDLVQEVLGLSPAETEIAVLLAEGRTLREIAATTGREYSTVRSHLKHMFAKLGSSRQFDVAQAVLALSSLPGTRD